MELGVAGGLAANGDRVAADVARGGFETATGGEESTDFASFDVIERAGTTGHGIRASGWKWYSVPGARYWRLE